MSEQRYVSPANGTELQIEDLESIGKVAAWADDRVLWELTRLLPGSATPQKGIIPYGVSGWADSGLNSTGLVNGETADGKVRVMPFRAVVGSTTLVGTSVKEHLRGIRTGYHVGASTLHREVSIAANAAGNPRWTLVYATITPDVSDAGVTRYKKDPTSGVITSSSVSVSKSTTVTINTVDGAAAASPTPPALPADAGGAFNISLAYVWVPDGFGSGSTVGRGQIWILAPCLPLNSATGATASRPANQSFTLNGEIHTNQGHNQALRPGAYLPPDMCGGERLVIPIQRGLAPLSHADGDTIDNSIDWRYRYFFAFVVAKSGSAASAALASDRNLTGTAPAHAASLRVHGTHTYWTPGQSFVADGASLSINPGDSNGAAVFVTDAELSQLGASTVLMIYVRNTDGALIFKTSGAGTYQAVVHLYATGPYSLFGQV